MKPLKYFLITSSAIVSLMICAQQIYAAKPRLEPDNVEKSYRATGCQVHPSDAEAVTYQLGGICNNPDLYPPSDEIEVVCPIVRDLANQGPAFIVVDVGVTSSPIECTAYSWYGPGSLVGTTVDEETAQSTNLAFSTIFLILEEADNEGSYSLTCTLPSPVSSADLECIHSYRVWEWTSEWE
jgi:hypothetical protein